MTEVTHRDAKIKNPVPEDQALISPQRGVDDY